MDLKALFTTLHTKGYCYFEGGVTLEGIYISFSKLHGGRGDGVEILLAANERFFNSLGIFTRGIFDIDGPGIPDQIWGPFEMTDNEIMNKIEQL